MEWIELKDGLPEKGKDVLVRYADGVDRWVYRCCCHVDKCKTFNLTGLGYSIIGTPLKWRKITPPQPQTKLKRV